MTINKTTGNLSGTPTRAGVYNVTVIATDNKRDPTTHTFLTGEANYLWTVQLGITPSAARSLTPGSVGQVYSSPIFTATGGNPNDSYSFSALGLPAGLTLGLTNGQWMLTGTPQVSGSFTVTVTATDVNDPELTGTQEYSLSIGKFTLTTSSLPAGTVGNAYTSTTLTTNDSGDNQTFTATGLPTGLTLSPQGVLAGTPLEAGQFSVTVNATDPDTGDQGGAIYQLFISPALTLRPGSLPSASANDLYSLQFNTYGGTSGATYNYQAAGSLPSGITLSLTGLLSGTTTQTGVFPFYVQVTDASNSSLTLTQLEYLTVYPLTLSPNGAGSALTATSGTPFSQTLTASGGGTNDAYDFAETGSLPPGVTLAHDGVLSGTPLLPGTFNFVVTATDSSRLTGSQQYTLTVDPVVASPTSIALSPTLLPPGDVGDKYAPFQAKGGHDAKSYVITASGGSGSYNWSYTGSLPPGITFTAGTFSGTPTQAGTFDFTIIASDANNSGLSGSQSYELTIAPKPPVHFTPQQLQQAYGSNNVILSGGVLGNGTGQTIAIISEGDDPTIESDLAQFDAYLGLPAPPSFLKLDTYGGTTDYPATGSTSETAIDVESAHAMAPGANIILFETTAKDLATAITTALSYPGVTVVSISYGGGPNTGSVYLAPAGKDVTILAAGGDNKSELDPQPAGIYPAQSPYVLAVTMSLLATDSQGNYIGELGNNSPTSSGGPENADSGTDAKSPPQPTYQEGVVPTSISIGPGRTTPGRANPDVAFNGQWDSGTGVVDDGKWIEGNGSSQASPSWAGLIAIANEGLAHRRTKRPQRGNRYLAGPLQLAGQRFQQDHILV